MSKLATVRDDQLREARVTLEKMKHGLSLPADGKKVLIVDDEAYNCEVLKSIMTLLNPELKERLIICLGAQEALDAVRSSLVWGRTDKRCVSTIGLVFTDLSMPMIDGY